MLLLNARGVRFLERLSAGLSRLGGVLGRAGSAGEVPIASCNMSDQLKKFEIQVSHEFMRLLSAIGGVYVAVCYLDYIDAEYGLWLTWLLTPLIITFLLPAVLVVLIYTSAIIFHVYRLYRLRLVAGVQGDWRNAARLAVCALWDAHGWLWHGADPACLALIATFTPTGYEISGLENIPEGPCLFIYYHGAVPVDMYYFVGRMYLLKRKMIHTVADHFMFKIPGWSIILDGLCVIPGSVQSCTGILRAGNSLAISPGGVYEAQFGDHHYDLQWKSRIGFAKVALEAKVPIVPMFTQNVREAFRTVGWLRWVWLRIYQATRIPLAPVYGGFPVKLLTHLGAPIPYDPTLTPQQLQLKVARAIEELVEEHQRVPGSILRALIDRVYRVPKRAGKPAAKAKPANGMCANGRTPTLDAAKADQDIRHSEKFVDRDGERENAGGETGKDVHYKEERDTEKDKDATVNSQETKDLQTDVKNSPTSDKYSLTLMNDILADVRETLAKRKDNCIPVKENIIDKRTADNKMKVL